MPDTTRRVLLSALAAAPVPAMAQTALPAGWPDHSLRMIVPAAGGGGGYTMLYGWAGTLATNPAMYRDLPFDPLWDFEPVILIGNVPNILVVNRDLGIHTMAEFTTYARAHPGALSFGSSGNGSSMHLAGEMYRQATGTDMVHVPYNAVAQGVNDPIAGRIQVMFNLITGMQNQVKAGMLTPIAVLSDRRAAALPDVPTAAEAGMPGLEFGTWFCLMFPRGTPQRLTEFLTSEIRRHGELVRPSGASMN